MSMDSKAESNAYDPTKPLDPPEDEAIAQYLSTPKSIREFKSFSELARHFNISRMTAQICYVPTLRAQPCSSTALVAGTLPLLFGRALMFVPSADPPRYFFVDMTASLFLGCECAQMPTLRQAHPR
jgi:hypothetical protein